LIKESYNVSASVNFGIVPCCYKYSCFSVHSNPRFSNQGNSFGDAFDVFSEIDTLHWLATHSSHINIHDLDDFGKWPLKEKIYVGNCQLDSLEAVVVIDSEPIKCIKYKNIQLKSDSGYI
jgi:hypothetical protein